MNPTERSKQTHQLTNCPDDNTGFKTALSRNFFRHLNEGSHSLGDPGYRGAALPATTLGARNNEQQLRNFARPRATGHPDIVLSRERNYPVVPVVTSRGLERSDGYRSIAGRTGSGNRACADDGSNQQVPVARVR